MHSNVKTFHVPLPPATYAELKAEAQRAGRTATSAAREAIEQWLLARKKMELHEAIAEYAAKHAGTSADLDPALEAAGVRGLRRKSR